MQYVHSVSFAWAHSISHDNRENSGNILDKSANPKELESRRFAYCLFFVCGLGMSFLWNAVNGSITNFTTNFGKSVFMNIQIAYYLPVVPILLLQQQYDERMNLLYGYKLAYTTRIVLCYSLASGVALSFAYIPLETEKTLLLLVLLLGIANGIQWGSFYQLASMYSSTCMTAFSIGFQASPILLLAPAQWIMKHPLCRGLGWKKYWAFSCGISILGMICFLVLINHKKSHGYLQVSQPISNTATTPSKSTVYYECHTPLIDRSQDSYSSDICILDNDHLQDIPDRPYSTPSNSPQFLTCPILERSYSNNETENRKKLYFFSLPVEEETELVKNKDLEKSEKTIGMWDLYRALWRCCFSSLLSFSCGLILINFIPFVPRKNQKQDMQRILVFINMFGNFAGRCIALFPRFCIKTQNQVLSLVSLRIVLTILFFIYIEEMFFLLNDIAVWILFSLFTALAGYLAVVTISVACSQVEVQCRPKVTLVINLHVFVGIYSSFLFCYVYVWCRFHLFH